MIHIVLCSEKTSDRKSYWDELEVFCNMAECETDIHVISRMDKLIEKLRNQPGSCDILYLDIGSADSDGIETAEELRKNGYQGELIFLLEKSRDMAEKLQRAFDVQAFNCIIKGICSEARRRMIFSGASQKAMRRREDLIAFQNKGEQKYVALSDIMYFEVVNRIITVYYGAGEKFKFYSTMDRLEAQLSGKGFLRIHRSFLVNMRNIAGSTRETVQMKSGQSIAIGASYRSAVRKCLEQACAGREENTATPCLMVSTI